MKEDGDDEKREVFFFLNQSQIPRLAQERNTWLKMGDMYVARCRSRRQVVDGELHQALAQCVCVEEGMGWGGCGYLLAIYQISQNGAELRCRPSQMLDSCIFSPTVNPQ